MLLDCAPAVKEKALNALNNLSMNIKNQEEIQVSLLQGKNKSEAQEIVWGFQHIFKIRGRMLKCFAVKHESHQL